MMCKYHHKLAEPWLADRMATMKYEQSEKQMEKMV